MPAAAAGLRRIRVLMRPETARWPEAPGYAAGLVVVAEYFPGKALVGRGARWTTVVDAAGASAEPRLPPKGTTNTESKAALAVGEKALQPGRRSTVATETDTRATNLP